MVARSTIECRIREALSQNPVVLLTGPRQCGKTTIARTFVEVGSPNYFDLEDPADLARLDEPMVALRPLHGLVVIDEVQRRPDLFPTLRVLSDRASKEATFLILGSASGALLNQSSESLAGRLERVEMGGLSLGEVGVESEHDLWLRGAFPRSFLAASERASVSWRREFVASFLERDLPQWGVGVAATALRRFWMMLAHYHGQVWNASEAARGIGVSPTAARHYIDLLTDGYMVRQLQPYFANVGKRQVRAPKVYIRDSGLLHQLLGIDTRKGLLVHPKVGHSWEGFVVEQLLSSDPTREAYFWGTHAGAELDLILRIDGRLVGIECKRTDRPRVTPSIRSGLADLGLDRVAVLYPGTKRFAINDSVFALPVSDLATAAIDELL